MYFPETLVSEGAVFLDLESMEFSNYRFASQENHKYCNFSSHLICVVERNNVDEFQLYSLHQEKSNLIALEPTVSQKFLLGQIRKSMKKEKPQKIKIMEIQADSGNANLLTVHYVFEINELSHSVIVTYELVFQDEKYFLRIKEV